MTIQEGYSMLPPLKLHKWHLPQADGHRVAFLSADAVSAALECSLDSLDGQEESWLAASLELSGLKISNTRSREDLFYLPLAFAEAEIRYSLQNADQPYVVLTIGGQLRPRPGRETNQSIKDQIESRGDARQLWVMVVDGDHAAACSVLDAFHASGTICERPLASFDIDKEPLGFGPCATIHKAYSSRSSGDHDDDGVALKIIKPAADVKQCKSILSEVSTLVASQGHPNIVKFYGLFHFNEPTPDVLTYSPRVGISMQHCCHGDLFTITQNGGLPESRAHEVMCGLLSALSHIHGCGIVHRDVKPENVMIAHGGRPVLIDFGIAARLSDDYEMMRKCGSPGYVAPEVLKGCRCGIEVDSFGAGALLYFIISQRPAFTGSSMQSTVTKIISRPVQFKRPAFELVTLECILFMQAMLHKEPDKRMTAEAALADPWIVNAAAAASTRLSSTSTTPTTSTQSVISPSENCTKQAVLIGS